MFPIGAAVQAAPAETGDGEPEAPTAAIAVSPRIKPDLPPGVGADWWAMAQEDIRQSEYQVTWQDRAFLVDVANPSAMLSPGAYQAPNRAHNLRTYFTPQGARIIPRSLMARIRPGNGSWL